ncbi:Ig-like domain-containing protein [Chloroflexus sp.]|uniref:Ig-like domain-containing alpha-2-macroglobulin family protein n=1 Tax=Chloroflexus sp. TaxID=1904827 RepID=UPI003C739BF3
MITRIQHWLGVLARLWTIMLFGVVISLLGGLAIRWLVPVLPWAETPTAQLRDPLPQSQVVPPRSTITLVFSTPMNPFTVVRALRIDPPIAGKLEWSEDRRSVRLIPDQPLQPATTYRVQVMTNAQSQWWRPLARSLDVEFTTAAQPTVTAALAPQSRTAPIALIFSQPMVEPDAIGQPASLEQIRISPPLQLNGEWLDRQTLLLQPITAFTAITTYTLTLDANLRDARGIELGQPFQWQFTTPWPILLEHTPLPNEQWVNPQQPLTLVFDAPIDTRLLSSALTITPAVSGNFSSFIDGNRYITIFTPYNGWSPGQTYQIRLQPDPSGEPVAAWSFTVETEPLLIASFPGQGQTLAPGQAIRLIFSTPMDEAEIRAGLHVDPPVASLELEVDENRITLQPLVQAATTYTITIAAGTRDRSGVPLARDVSLTIRTASAPPQLQVIGETILSFLANVQPVVTIERMNLSVIDSQLYQLDPSTLIRALSLRPTEWASFVPERYGQPLVRAWRELLNDPADTLVRSLLPITTNSAGDPLPPGAYYLRMTGSAGLRADRLLLISSLNLSLLVNNDELLLWVTTGGTGTPAGNIPLTVYIGETVLARGTSDDQGLWRVPLTGLSTRNSSLPLPIIALAEGNGLALARTELRTTQPRIQALLAPDRLSYRPGGVVRINGLVRAQQPDGRLGMPTSSNCTVQLDGPNLIDQPPAVACTVSDTGIVNGSLQLNARTPPGLYTATVVIGDSVYRLPIRVREPSTVTAVQITPARPAGLAVDVTRAGLPVSGATISWTLRLETLAVAELDGVNGVVIGGVSENQAGATTDASGRAMINLPADENLLRPLRYQLALTVLLPDGEQLSRETEGVITPRSSRLVIDTPAIIERNERATITMWLRTADGAAIENTLVELEVRRNPTEPPLIVRRVRTNNDGQASADLVPLAPGRYELTARAGMALSRRPLWVAGFGLSTAEPQIIPDRSSYTVGETARVLITGPAGSRTLLLIIGQGAHAQTLITTAQSGTVLDLPISTDLAPMTLLTALIDDGVRHWMTSTTISIDPPPPPELNISQSDVLPGTTVTFTATAATDTLLVVLTSLHSPPVDLTHWNQPLAPLTRAPKQQTDFDGIILPASIQSNQNQHTISVTLPNQLGRWRLSVIAVYPNGIATIASAMLDTNQLLEAIAIPLPALRPADTVTATLILRNLGGQDRTVRSRLWLNDGILLDPLEQTTTVPAGTTVPIAWRLQPQPDAKLVSLRYEVFDTISLPPIEYSIPVWRDPPLYTTGQTYLAADPITITLPDGDNEVVIAASVRAALADQAQRLLQTTPPTAETLAAAIVIGRELERTATTTAEADRWRTAIENVLPQLRSLRNPDGGWGWWPNTASDPFVTAFVLEAIGRLPSPSDEHRELSEPALSYLRRTRLMQPADAQAYINYVMSLHGANPAPALPTGAGPAGRAFTALQLPNERGTLLNPLQVTVNSHLLWSGAEGLPPSTLAVSASVIQALAQDRPSDPRLTQWRTALIQHWQIDGWATPYEVARVALALNTTLLADDGEVQVFHNNMLTTDRPLGEVARFRLNGGTLQIEPAQTAALITVRRPAPPAQPNEVRARLQYLTSTNSLTVDRPVQIELILLTTQPLFRLDVAVPLPAGLTPLAVDAGTELTVQPIDRERRQVRLGGVRLARGVYRILITAQTTATGSFTVPPAFISMPGSDLAPVVAEWQTMIAITPKIDE